MAVSFWQNREQLSKASDISFSSIFCCGILQSLSNNEQYKFGTLSFLSLLAWLYFSFVRDRFPDPDKMRILNRLS